MGTQEVNSSKNKETAFLLKKALVAIRNKSSALKIIFYALFVAGSGILLSLFLILKFSTQVTFQSSESVTEMGSPIFNQVKFIAGWKEDVWIMRQSHKGYESDKDGWDRLAIVIDKTKTPYQATFSQFQPGKLELGTIAAPLKARCYACHVSGPRVIRPNFDSPSTKLGHLEKIQIGIWNLRIKLYGSVVSKPSQNSVLSEGAPFKSNHPIMARPLGLKSCTICHKENGIRNELKIEHLGTARFLVKNGLMPPFPFQISEKDAAALKENKL